MSKQKPMKKKVKTPDRRQRTSRTVTEPALRPMAKRRPRGSDLIQGRKLKQPLPSSEPKAAQMLGVPPRKTQIAGCATSTDANKRADRRRDRHEPAYCCLPPCKNRRFRDNGTLMRHAAARHAKHLSSEDLEHYRDKGLEKVQCPQCPDMVSRKHLPRHI